MTGARCNGRTRQLFFSLIVFIFFVGGCGSREHIDPNFGVSTREIYAKQRVHHAPSTERPTGLDSEEAALVHNAYRTSLGGGKGVAKEPGSRVLLLEENGKK